MPSAELVTYSVDPVNDCVSGTLRLDSGQIVGHTFRESQYLPNDNWTTADLLAAFTHSVEDHATITLAQKAAEIDATLSLVKQQAADAVTALTAPPENADATIQEVEASVNAHVEAANKLVAVRDNLIRTAVEAKRLRDEADAVAARERATVEAAAEVERAKAARATEDARIAELVRAQVAEALAKT